MTKMSNFAENNRRAWEHRGYEGWVRTSGTPAQFAQTLIADPTRRLIHLAEFLGDVKDRRILNLMGSNGRKAVPLALLGADVTVIDISRDAARYARELADAAGVQIDYRIADVLSVSPRDLGNFDLVLLEGGVLIYIESLARLFSLVRDVLVAGGSLILQDGHPMSRRLNRDQDGASDSRGEPSFAEGLASWDGPQTHIKRWTLGEIITAVAESGLSIQQLTEHSYRHDAPLPEIFTLVAAKR